MNAYQISETADQTFVDGIIRQLVFRLPWRWNVVTESRPAFIATIV